jgi:hypothetical protein
MAVLTTSQAATRSPDAASIVGEIRDVGAKRVVAKYYDTKTWEHIIMPGIRRADQAWLQVAEELHKGSDAGASEDLDSTLYDALPAAPYRVLLVIQRMYGSTAEDVCTMTFEAEIPKGGVAPYLQRIERGLGNPNTQQQVEMAKLCRRGLAKTREYAKANGLK